MSTKRPLDVDGGLPLPEVGQASTVFSLTALFGAYFGIYLMLGLPALAGLACGTVVGLFAIRGWIKHHESRTFEEFLVSVLTGRGSNVNAFAITVVAVQCAYGASELLILREIARYSLGMRSDQATLLAVAVGIIGYFYVLLGGYMAVFRTDVLQFLLVAGMALVLTVHSLSGNFSAAWETSLWPRAGYWELPLWSSHAGYWRYIYHFVIGGVMGLGFLSAAPDAWKRVFIVTVFRKKSVFRFLAFIGVGITPFLVLVPLAVSTPPIPNGSANVSQLFASFLAGDVLFIAAALGLIASFLSSFDSAVLASVHVGLILRRKQGFAENEMSRFHWLMVTSLLTIFCLFFALVSFDNPYLLANLLLGLYAILGGIQVGTRAMPGYLPENSILWVIVVSSVGWFLYFLSVVGLPRTPTTWEVNTVPGGVSIFAVITLTCYVLKMWEKRHVRHHH